MWPSYFSIFIILLINSFAQGQRVAPGVPPQQYDQYQHQPHQQQQYQPPPQPQQHQQQYQAPPPQYQQQVPVHQQQQAPIQYQQQQQAPVQQNYQQQPPPPPQQPQQNQPQHGHGHGHGHGQPQQVLNAANIQQEREHIAEHLDVPMDTSKMTDQELQFHYFKMHDSDNNNKLDGCELIKSLIHWHEQGSKDENRRNSGQQIEEKIFTDEELVSLIDPILQMDDTSRDGYIDYPEFIKAQQKAAAQQQKHQQQNQPHGN